MSAQTVEPESQPPTGPLLLVRYSPEVEDTARQLPAPVARTLRKAVGVLLRNPFPEESDPVSVDGRERSVHASKTLALRYTARDGYLTIDAITYTPPPMTVVDDAPDDDLPIPAPAPAPAVEPAPLAAAAAVLPPEQHYTAAVPVFLPVEPVYEQRADQVPFVDQLGGDERPGAYRPFTITAHPYPGGGRADPEGDDTP